MTRLLIPDAGPLFSLAAGNLLHLLARFRVGITDIVHDETVKRGRSANASNEARNLLAYYKAHSANITTVPTQVGAIVAARKATDPRFQPPANLGELSIQSFLIELQMTTPGASPVILFEDSWFLRNAQSLQKPYLLLSTQAFLEYAQEKQWIASAGQARNAIMQARPYAYKDSVKMPAAKRSS